MGERFAGVGDRGDGVAVEREIRVGDLSRDEDFVASGPARLPAAIRPGRGRPDALLNPAQGGYARG